MAEDEINNYCIICHKGVSLWFHGQGVICEECGQKGFTRQNCVPPIDEVWRQIVEEERAKNTTLPS